MFTMFPDFIVNKFDPNIHQNKLWLIENDNKDKIENLNYNLLPIASCSNVICNSQQSNENINKNCHLTTNNKRVISNKQISIKLGFFFYYIFKLN